MTTITYTPIEHTGPIGRVWRPDGVVARQTDGPIEWTTFDRRPPGSNQGQQQRPIGKQAEPLHASNGSPLPRSRPNPDLTLRGLVVLYGVPLPNDQGDQLMFTPDTEWSADDPWVPVQLEHGGSLVGVGRIIETDDGMFIEGNVFAARTKALGDRRELSVGLVDILTVRRPGGVLEVVDATLTEVSLVHRGRWGWCTKAALVPAA